MTDEEACYKFKMVCFAVVAMIISVTAIHFWASLPVVTISHSTGACVSVSDIDGLYDCENLPRKYETVWAQ